MNVRSLSLTLSAALAIGLLASAVPTSAQTVPATTGDPYCGAWVSGTWTPNGYCAGYLPTMTHATVSGTITAVRGHLVTIQQSNGTIVINDSPALRRETSGRVAVGRQIVATGYWRAKTFYATNIE